MPADTAVEAILADLVAVPSLPDRPNGAMTDCLMRYLDRKGVEVTRIPGPTGDRFNLFATIGPREVPGYILSGHSDVVPAEGQDWHSDPFCLTRDGDRLIGRGTTDMKGFLASALSMLPELLDMDLRRPIHLAFSYDEEIGCRGVGHLIARLPDLCAPPLGAIIGEPSEMRPVLSHKGKQAIEVTITGQAGHSSNPALGVNALYPAGDLLLQIRDQAARLAVEGPFDPRFDPPHSTLQAGVIMGGAAVNIIPDCATLQIEARTIPGQAPQTIIAELLARLDDIAAREASAGRAIGIRWQELSSYPALPPPSDGNLAMLLKDLTGNSALASVSYGTEAGLFHAAGVPAIICGPGSISRAHRADEFIRTDELEACRAMIRGLGLRARKP